MIVIVFILFLVYSPHGLQEDSHCPLPPVLTVQVDIRKQAPAIIRHTGRLTKTTFTTTISGTKGRFFRDTLYMYIHVKVSYHDYNFLLKL